MRNKYCVTLFFQLVYFVINSFSQNFSIDEKTANGYFAKNFRTLNKIEGIYNIRLKIEPGIIGLKYCDYPNFSVDNYDRIAIIKSGDKYIEYSFRKKSTNGYFYYENSISNNGILNGRPYLALRNVSNYRNSINNPKTENFTINKFFNDEGRSQKYDFNFQFPSDEKHIFDKILQDGRVFIKCNDSDTREELDKDRNSLVHLSSELEVTFEYLREFPKEDFVPDPQVYYGTCFLINSNSYFVTNYHVIQEIVNRSNWNFKYNLNIILNNSKSSKEESFPAEIVKFDSINDLAIIKIINGKKSSPPPYGISKQVSMGQNAFTLGYPLISSMGKSIKLSKGIVTSEAGILDNPNFLTLDLNINNGNSGGPLFNMNGDIIGIINSRLNEDYLNIKVENVSYAIKSHILLDLLNTNDFYVNKLNRFELTNTQSIAPVKFEKSLTQTLRRLNFESKISQIKRNIGKVEVVIY